MSEMVERVAKAIQAELRRQGKLYPFPPEEPDPAKLMMPTGECADLTAVVRAAMEAMKYPDKGEDRRISRAGAEAAHTTGLEEGYADALDLAEVSFNAMIDAGLAETS